MFITGIEANTKYKIFDATGKTLFVNKTLNNDKLILDFTKLSSGIYTIIFENNAKIVLMKK